MEKPWITGPQELLQHGLEHMRLASDFDKRIAMISIDNAVELMIKTYLGLPSRITGIKLSRRKLQEVSERFSDLLDALEEHAGDRIVGIELGSIEFFHRLRNQLYHEGIGITVEVQKLEGYTEMAVILFGNLFDVSVGEMRATVQQSVVGQLISKWAILEQTLRSLVGSRVPDQFKHARSALPSAAILTSAGIVNGDFLASVLDINRFRNNLVHGQATLPTRQVREQLSKLNAVLDELDAI